MTAGQSGPAGMVPLLILLLWLFGTASPPSAVAGGAGALPAAPLLLPGNAGQALLVTKGGSPSATRVEVRALERNGRHWRTVLGPFAAVVGRNGFAPPGEKREGDGRTPSGTFPLTSVFGYGPPSPTRMPYRQVHGEDLWVDDPASPDYNRWVVAGQTTATSYERLKRDDDLYKFTLVIAYNTDPVVPGLGSAIFVHLWAGPDSTTAGCIALAEADLLQILPWLDPAAGPVIILGTTSP